VQRFKHFFHFLKVKSGITKIGEHTEVCSPIFTVKNFLTALGRSTAFDNFAWEAKV
jgi:hypothetical protein